MTLRVATHHGVGRNPLAPGSRPDSMDAVARFADPLAQSIPARFEREVGRGPERLAVETRQQALRYGALNQAANRVAHAILAERGRGEEPIALLLEGGAAMTAATLGALSGEARFPHLRANKLVGEPTSRRDVERYRRHS